MSGGAQHQVLQLMSAKGRRAVAVADVVCRLAREGAELGGLVEIPAIGGDGQRRMIRVLPEQWLERVVRAVDAGAFERMDVVAIADRIIGTPLPEHLETKTV